MTTISLGRVALTWRGPYDAAALYHAQDIVHHDGSAHIALVDDLTGQTPGASPGWQLFAAGVPASPGTPTGTLLYRDEDGLIAPLNASPAEAGHLLTLDGEGRPVWVPPGNRPALRVTALETTFGVTSQHVRVIMDNGDLRAWGNGAALQLGQGNTTVNRTYPGSVAFPPGTPPIVEVKADSAGGAFAIDANGDLWVWGTNTTYGNLGNATLANIPLPFCVTQFSHASNSLFGKSVAKVAMKATGEGVYSTHVLCTDGTVHAAGYNLYGQIGDGTTTNTNVFKQVTGLSGITDLQCGRERFTSVFALNGAGEVFSWGYGADRILGHGGTASQLTPLKIAALNGITISAMSIAGQHAAFLDTQGRLYTQGTNTTYGALGTGDLANRALAVQVASAVAKVFCFGSGAFIRTFIIRTDGTLWACGSNANSALGVDTSATHYPNFTQCRVSFDDGATQTLLTDIVDVECNGHSVTVRDGQGRCYGVGAGAAGSLGVGLLDVTVAWFRPVLIHRRQIIDHAMGGTAGASITMFLLDDGQLFLCGVGTSGFNTNPLGQTIAVPAPVIF